MNRAEQSDSVFFGFKNLPNIYSVKLKTDHENLKKHHRKKQYPPLHRLHTLESLLASTTD